MKMVWNKSHICCLFHQGPSYRSSSPWYQPSCARKTGNNGLGGGGGGGGGNNGGATATLSVTAKVNGVVVAGYPATAASAPAITLTSGQELEVTSSTPTVFGGNLNGAVAEQRDTQSP